MSTRGRIILVLSVCALFTLVLLAPQLVRLSAVRTEIIARISKDTGLHIQAGKMKWHWLPLPHLSVHEVRFESDQMDLSLPEAQLYPNWLSVFEGRPELDEVVLRTPQLHVKSFDTLKPPATAKEHISENGAGLPQTRITIIDGTMDVDAAVLPGIARTRALTVSAIQAVVHIGAEKINLRLECNTSFTTSVILVGSISIPDISYSLSLDCQGLRLHKSVQSLANGQVVPVESEADIQATITGAGFQSAEAHIIGVLPCFLVKPRDKTTLFTCGFADMTLKKQGRNIGLAIKKLELKEPGFTLSGSIERSVPDAGGAPRWTLDLRAMDLNLTEIRRAVLVLWGKHEIAEHVCDIVLGGSASSATYVFSGPVVDFEDIRNMTITADVVSAPIHVPGANLDLTEASGAIEIKDGKLTGQGLSAMLGNSRGSNCSLLVGLGRDDYSFHLDLDIAADLRDLPGVLKQLINDRHFLSELSRFHEVEGKANAHLKLGDSLHHIKTEVSVSNIEAQANYDRLSWPVSVSGGDLLVEPHRVRWQKVTAMAGPQRIKSTSGEVAWTSSADVRLGIETLDGEFAAAPLLKELHLYPALKKGISTALTEIDGMLEISDASFTGLLSKPAEWQYSFAVTASDLSFTSPLLGAPAFFYSASARISQEQVALQAGKARFIGNPLAVHGVFLHHLLQDWQGWAVFDGTIGQDLSGWISARKWIPQALYPQIPCTVREFRVSWGADVFELDGSVLAGAGKQDAPAMKIELRSTAANPLLVNATFSNQSEQASLTLDLINTVPETFQLHWQGILTARTVSALFAEHGLLSGKIEGIGSLIVPDIPQDSYFNGSVTVNGLRWPWPKEEGYAEVRNLVIEGKGNHIAIDGLQMDFSAGESVSAVGTVSAVAGGLALKLDLTSEALSQKTVKAFLANVQELKTKLANLAKEDQAPDESEPQWHITGTVGFDIAGFRLSQETVEPTILHGTLVTLRPYSGTVHLYAGGKVAVEITKADFCCLTTAGTWYSDASLGESDFTVTTACDPAPLFQDMLPCIGIEQDIIEGPFSFSAKLTGTFDNWEKGQAEILSPHGRILRMRLLSRIFKVINLTDFFTADDMPQVDGKGFSYSQMVFEADIEKNILKIKKAVIRGEGLNLFARGTMNLKNHEADFTVLIAPFKTLDKIVTKIPLVGRVIGGENATIVTIPVGVKGPITNPSVIPLSPDAIGEGIVNLVKDTLLLPFRILSPMLPDGGGGKND